MAEIPVVIIQGQSFGANQLISKTLVAAQEISIYRTLHNIGPKSKPVDKVPVGQGVGVVDSWVHANGILFWQYLDHYNRPYYTPHSSAAYSLTAIKDQGAKTTKEVIIEAKEKEEKDANPVGFYADKYIKMGIYGLLGIFAVQALFNSFKSK